jgi:hypothetical protein
VISIEPTIKFRLLLFCKKDGVGYFRDAIPDILDEDNALRHAQAQEIRFG